MQENMLFWGLLLACLTNVFCLCGNEAQQIWKPPGPRDAAVANQAGTYFTPVGRKLIGVTVPLSRDLQASPHLASWSQLRS
jgi:hypothetical protein